LLHYLLAQKTTTPDSIKYFIPWDIHVYLMTWAEKKGRRSRLSNTSHYECIKYSIKRDTSINIVFVISWLSIIGSNKFLCLSPIIRGVLCGVDTIILKIIYCSKAKISKQQYLGNYIFCVKLTSNKPGICLSSPWHFLSKFQCLGLLVFFFKIEKYISTATTQPQHEYKVSTQTLCCCCAADQATTEDTDTYLKLKATLNADTTNQSKST
jgi:hypothetical protein